MPKPITTERELIEAFKEAKDKVSDLTAQLDQAKSEYDYYEALLLEVCESKGTTKTAEYDRIGHVTVMKPQIFANYSQDIQNDLFSALRDYGRGDLIREVIYPAALSGFVGDTIDEIMQKPLSEEDRKKRLSILRIIRYYAQPKARLYEAKKQTSSGIPSRDIPEA